MKKVLFIFLFLFSFLMITGCSKERTIDYLMKGYVKAYTKADLASTKDIFPPYYVTYAEKYMTQEYLDKSFKDATEKYGDDFTITYEITKKTKLTDEELKELNEKIAKYFKTEEKATECYKFEGTTTFKGSKKEDKQSLSSLGYCKYKGVWYLVRK